ncbi:hypothetical protein A9R00_08100 [Oleispira antarctica]|uniref:DUF4124 domain-containing protein n=1 Tax=Oleispira antarctica TaxID=188908 RepID=A0A1Y5HRW6_OLEAN|nr:hypothetical protein A9R00_08100 [Oleispira antarctica]
MRHIIIKLVIVNILFIFFFPVVVHADIYRWVDEKGRVQFSDSPNPNYGSQALVGKIATPAKATDITQLQKTAKQLKRQRLKRESDAEKLFKDKRKKRLNNEKRIAKKKRKKEACDNARKKENLAFRQRSKSRNLTAMRKALDRYKKKRMIRINKCQ